MKNKLLVSVISFGSDDSMFFNRLFNSKLPGHQEVDNIAFRNVRDILERFRMIESFIGGQGFYY